MNNNNKCMGFTLLEFILAISLAAMVTILSFEAKHLEMQQMQARGAGSLLFEYNNAARAWIAAHPDASSGPREGSSWLKPASCGGTSSVQYLRCDFPAATTTSPIPNGKLTLSSVVEVTGSTPNKILTVRTTSSPYRISTGEVRSDLAGVATILASAGATQSSTPVLMGTDGQFTSSPNTGVITLVSSNNAENDVWLRTDGSNQMHANLRFDGASPELREIVGVSRVQNLAVETLYLGTSSGIAPVTGAKVVVDSDAEVIGGLRVRQALVVDNGATVTGAVAATQNVTAGGNVAAGGSVSGQAFIDSNDNSYFVDPNSASNLNALSTQSIRNSGTIDSAGRITVGEYINIQGRAVEGSSCSPIGLIGTDGTGQFLSCVGGTWKSPKSQSSWGGSYFYSPGHGGCYVANPLTGNCSCPTGYQTYTAYAIQVGGCYPCTMYQCAKKN